MVSKLKWVGTCEWELGFIYLRRCKCLWLKVSVYDFTLWKQTIIISKWANTSKGSNLHISFLMGSHLTILHSLLQMDRRPQAKNFWGWYTRDFSSLILTHGRTHPSPLCLPCSAAMGSRTDPQTLPDKVLALLACSTLVTAALWQLECGVIKILSPW